MTTLHAGHAPSPVPGALPAYGGMPDAAGLNFYDADPNLGFALAMRLEPEAMARAEPLLREAGEVAGGELDRLARDAETNPPRLIQYDRRGERIDEVVFHPAYRQMERIAFGRFGLAAMSHRPGVLGWPGPAPAVFKYALSYVLIQSEFGLFCPVNMTDSMARILRRFAPPQLQGRFIPRLATQDMDDLLQGTQWMTEKAGGSDVGAAETTACFDGDGWRLHGDKWFCSNVSADLALTLARPEGAPAGTRGLGLYLVPRRLDDGGRNRYRINRLKEKLGSRDMASGEVTFAGAFAWQIGGAGEGFKQMMEMVNASRLSNAMRAAAMTRRGLLESLVHAEGRVAFGRRLDELPLMRETLLELTLDSEAALAAVLHTGATYGRADAGEPGAAKLLRVLTPLIKLAVCKRARWSAGEAMEVRGGNGYIEDWINPRLLRDSHLGSIWEGSTNVMALDVLRALTHDDAAGALFADIEERLAGCAEPLVGEAGALLGPGLRRLREVVRQLDSMDAAEREAVMLRLAERLYHLYVASLLVEEAQVQSEAGSRRKLVVLLEYLRRRVLRIEEPWTGPRPGSREAFAAVARWQPAGDGEALPLLRALQAVAV